MYAPFSNFNDLRYPSVDVGEALHQSIHSGTQIKYLCHSPTHLKPAAEFAEGPLVQFRPDAGAGLKGEKTDALAAEAECQHEQPGAAVRAGDWISDGGAGAVIHLRLFAWWRSDHGACLGRRGSAQFADEALHAFVGPGEAMPVHQLLPDGHCVAACRQTVLNDFPVRFAYAGRAG